MLTNKDAYDLNSASSKIADMKLMLDLKLDLEVIKQTLLKAGITSPTELEYCRKYVESTPEFVQMKEYVDHQQKAIEFYKNNPEQHLRDVLKAKMDGRIR